MIYTFLKRELLRRFLGFVFMVGFLVLTVFLLSGCGGSGGGSEASENTSGAALSCSRSLVTGTWENVTTGERVEFGSDCSFASDLCLSSGNIDSVEETGGVTFVEVVSSGNVAGCLPLGLNRCVYSIDQGTPDFMGINCHPDGLAAFDAFYEKI